MWLQAKQFSCGNQSRKISVCFYPRADFAVIDQHRALADVFPDMQQPHLLLYLLFNIAVNVLPFYFHDIRRARRLDQQVET